LDGTFHLACLPTTNNFIHHSISSLHEPEICDYIQMLRTTFGFDLELALGRNERQIESWGVGEGCFGLGKVGKKSEYLYSFF